MAPEHQGQEDHHRRETELVAHAARFTRRALSLWMLTMTVSWTSAMRSIYSKASLTVDHHLRHQQVNAVPISMQRYPVTRSRPAHKAAGMTWPQTEERR